MRLLHPLPAATLLVCQLVIARAQQTTSGDPPPVHRETISVVGDVAPDPSQAPAENTFTLSGQVLENLSTVLADDPLRAIAAVPGAAANDDFSARFSLRGADPSRIGFFLDGVLLHQPVHTLEGTDLIGSASVFIPTLTQSIDVYSSGYLPRFGNTSAGAVDVHMRDPDASRYTFVFDLNFGSAAVSASGPFGDSRTCSWIGGYRKSFVQAFLDRDLSDSAMAFGIADGEGRLLCRVSSKNLVSLDVLESFTNLNRSALKDQLVPETPMLVNQRSSSENFGWQFTPAATAVITSHLALQRDNFDDQNPGLQPLSNGRYQEWSANIDLSWLWNPHGTFSAGFAARNISETGLVEQYDLTSQAEVVDQYRGSGVLQGAYMHQSWSLLQRIHISAGIREDHHSADAITAWSPQASMQIRLLANLELLADWAEYTQFPDMSQFGSNLGSFSLLPVRSIQSNAGLQGQLGDKTKLRLELYNRDDRHLLFQPQADPRILNGAVINESPHPYFENSLSGYGRGLEFYLERSQFHHLGGWISYAYGHSEMHDAVTGSSFPSDYDQRHTASGFLIYHLQKSVTISSRWTYGSGFPIPGYFALNPLGMVAGTPYILSSERNQLRLPPYQRLDLRMNKEWGVDRKAWRKTLYVEVTNLTNKTNERFGSFNANYGTAAYLSLDTMFPILPTVGFVLER